MDGCAAGVEDAGEGFKTELRKLALLGGLASVLSFLLLTFSVGGYGEGVARIVTTDWVALAGLPGGGGLGPAVAG